MIIVYKSGRRGRPLNIDIEKERAALTRSFRQAAETLEKERKTTSGIRGADVFGDVGLPPTWYREAELSLERLKSNISYQEAKDELSKIRAVQKTVRQLASKRSDARGRGLYDIISGELKRELAAQEKAVISSKSKELLKKLEQNIEKLSKKEQVDFAKSRHYQDVRTASTPNKYRHALEWAREQTGDDTLTQEESFLCIINRRLEDGLGVTEDLARKAGKMLDQLEEVNDVDDIF